MQLTCPVMCLDSLSQLATLAKGRVPYRICNPNPYLVEVLQALALAFQVTTGDNWGEQNFFLNGMGLDVVEVSVQQVGARKIEKFLKPHPVEVEKGVLKS